MESKIPKYKIGDFVEVNEHGDIWFGMIIDYNIERNAYCIMDSNKSSAWRYEHCLSKVLTIKGGL